MRKELPGCTAIYGSVQGLATACGAQEKGGQTPQVLRRNTANSVWPNGHSFGLWSPRSECAAADQQARNSNTGNDPHCIPSSSHGFVFDSHGSMWGFQHFQSWKQSDSSSSAGRPSRAAARIQYVTQNAKNETPVLRTFKNCSYTTNHTPLVIHHSSYITHHTPLIIHHSSYTTHHTPLIIHPSSNTTHHTSLFIHRSSYTTHHTHLIIHHSSYTTHHTPLIIHHSSYTTHHTPLIIRHLSYTAHRTPLIIHHSSYATFHTPLNSTYHAPLIIQLASRALAPGSSS